MEKYKNKGDNNGIELFIGQYGMENEALLRLRP